MADDVARLLPICENCLASYAEDRGPEAAEILQDRLLNPQNYLSEKPAEKVSSEPEPSEDIDEEPLSWPSEVPVMTLREYLSM